MSQVAYQGGHIGFAGGKRVFWVYDITALTQHEAQVAEQERQLHEILEYCPAGLCVVDEEGRLLFHNRRLRELTGYEKRRAGAVRHQAVLARPRASHTHHRAAAYARRPTSERGGDLEDQAGELLDLLISYVQVAYAGGHVAVAGASGCSGSTTSRRCDAPSRRGCAASAGSPRRSRASPKASSATTARTGW